MLLIFALISFGASQTDNCSSGDLDFLCNSPTCLELHSNLVDTLCSDYYDRNDYAGTQDPPTLPTFVTGQLSTMPITLLPTQPNTPAPRLLKSEGPRTTSFLPPTQPITEVNTEAKTPDAVTTPVEVTSTLGVSNINIKQKG